MSEKNTRAERAAAETRRKAIEALQIEREGYVRRNLPDRIAQVDAELARHGVKPSGSSAPAPARNADPSGQSTATPGAGKGRGRKATKSTPAPKS